MCSVSYSDRLSLESTNPANNGTAWKAQLFLSLLYKNKSIASHTHPKIYNNSEVEPNQSTKIQPKLPNPWNKKRDNCPFSISIMTISINIGAIYPKIQKLTPGNLYMRINNSLTFVCRISFLKSIVCINELPLWWPIMSLNFHSRSYFKLKKDIKLNPSFILTLKFQPNEQ